MPKDTIKTKKQLIAELEMTRQRCADLEEQLRATHQKNKPESHPQAGFRQIFDQAPIGIFVADDKHRILEANPYGLNLLGYSLDEIKGMTAYELIHEEDLSRLSPGVPLKQIETNKVVETERRFLKKDGNYIHVLISLGRFRSYNDQKSILVMFQDITRRKQTEETLRASEENLRMTLNSIGDGVITTDVNGNVTRMNPVAKRLTGCGRDDFAGRPLEKVFNIINAQTGEVAENPVKKVFARDAIVGLANHTMLISRDGSKYQISDSAAPIRDVNGHITGVVMVFRDMTKEYNMRQQIFESRELLESVMNAIPDPIGVLDNNFHVIRYNQAGYEMLHKSYEDVQGKKCYELINRTLPCEICAVQKSYLSGKMERVERYEEHIDRWIDLRAYPIWDEAGNITKIIEHFQDITPIKKYEKKLVRAQQEADAANRAKSEFLANMSHEIRTPLNGIMGMLQLMQSTSLDVEQDEYVCMANKSTRRLSKLLADILDLSKIEAHKMDIREEEFELSEIMLSIKDIFIHVAEKNNNSLQVTADKNLPPRLLGDDTRLTQILFNLVGNACKYTHDGEVEVRACSLSNQGTSTCHVLFIVRDTGAGIPAEKISEVFEAFSQVNENESPFARRYEGAGLGLPLVKRLTNLLGGNLSISSHEGQGTEIYLNLPFGIPETYTETVNQGKTESAFPDENSRTILLVDDDKITRLYMKKLLEKSGIRVLLAEDGKEALSCIDKNRPDLILMDIQMPIMDGVEATKKIRNGETNTPEVPIIALTAYAMAGDREKFITAGMNDYISKPVDADNLMEILQKFLP